MITMGPEVWDKYGLVIEGTGSYHGTRGGPTRQIWACDRGK